MAVFTLKAHNTRPILEVALKNADGSAHDLTGSTSWKLHIRVSPTVVFTRDLVKQGLDTAGVLRYSWVDLDWVNPAVPAEPVLPTPTSTYKTYELEMEYEVIAGVSRMTFPNSGFDILEIYSTA